jgi:hypothetical protein
MVYPITLGLTNTLDIVFKFITQKPAETLTCFRLQVEACEQPNRMSSF